MDKEQLIYSGIPTFMGGKLIFDKKLSNFDVVFVGVPTDYGATYRLGAKYAPRKLRELSFWLRIDGSRMYDYDTEEILKANNLKIGDYGDVEIDPTHPNKNQNNISKTVYEVRKKTFPLVCGGDHSVTYGSFVGCYKALKEKYPDYDLGIIHIDAHVDVEDEYLNMPRVWHGNVFRRLIEDGFLKGENLHTIGPRGVENYELIEYIREQKINLYPNKKVKEMGLNNILEKIKEQAINKKIMYYITFDIDGLDMVYAQGTGTPQSDGLKVNECNYFFRNLKELNIIGFDIVELNPILDPSSNSFIVACELLYNFLAFGFNEKNYKNKNI